MWKRGEKKSLFGSLSLWVMRENHRGALLGRRRAGAASLPPPTTLSNRERREEADLNVSNYHL